MKAFYAEKEINETTNQLLVNYNGVRNAQAQSNTS